MDNASALRPMECLPYHYNRIAGTNTMIPIKLQNTDNGWSWSLAGATVSGFETELAARKDAVRYVKSGHNISFEVLPKETGFVTTTMGEQTQ